MFRYQKGLTTIGWLVLLLPLAVVVYSGVRLTPVYLNYMNVARTLNEVADQYRIGGATPNEIRQSIASHFMIDEVNYPTVNDIAISRDGDRLKVEAAYYDQAPLFANITLQVAFDKTVTLGAGGT